MDRDNTQEHKPRRQPPRDTVCLNCGSVNSVLTELPGHGRVGLCCRCGYANEHGRMGTDDEMEAAEQIVGNAVAELEVQLDKIAEEDAKRLRWERGEDRPPPPPQTEE